MTRGRLIFFFLSVALVLPLVTGGLRGEGDDGDRSLYRNLSVFTEVLSLVRRAYVEEVDVETLMNGALDGTADALDAFAVFVPAEAVPTFLAAREVGSDHSGLVTGKERGVAFVLGLDEDGPAAQAGLEVGDVITKIDGRSTREMPLWEVEVALAAEPGTVLELETMRQGETREETLTLAVYEAAVPRLDDHDGIGVLRIPRFDPETPRLVTALLDGFAGDRLALDLRRAAMGGGERAFEVAGLFVQGDLGRLLARGEALEIFRSEQSPRWSGTLVVLVDRATLGPAELLATILRQGAGATLVGHDTFGYAGRQAVLELSGGSRVRLTDAFFSGPDEEPVTESLEPDVSVALRGPGLPSGEDESPEDLILEEGLRILREEESGEEVREAA